MPHRTGARTSRSARARPCLSSTRDRLADLPATLPASPSTPSWSRSPSRTAHRPSSASSASPRSCAPSWPTPRRSGSPARPTRSAGSPAPGWPPRCSCSRASGRRTRSPPRPSAAPRAPRRASSPAPRASVSRSRPTTPSRWPPSRRAPCSARTPTRATAPPRRPSRRPSATIQVVTAHPRDRATLAAVARAEVVAAAVHGTRDLVNAAPNDLYPAAFAEAAKAAVKDSGAKGLKITVLDDKALAAGGYGGLIGVGQGSVRGPRLVKVVVLAVAPEGQGRARRQGHHVRLGRHLDQARRRHGGHEVRHGRCRRRAAHRPRRRAPRAARRGHRLAVPGGEHAVRARPSARPTC